MSRARVGALRSGDYAADLDLIGQASLMHLPGTASTPVGQGDPGALAARLQAHRDRMRQVALAELALLADFRDEFALRGRQIGAVQPSYQAFAGWAAGPPWLAQHAWLLWLARLLPLGALAGWGAQFAGLTALPLWAPFVLASLVLT